MALNNDISKQIQAFYEKPTRDPHHRYRSWEHCFIYFSRYTASPTAMQADVAALQLAFYLASWGMYRGSSALLWKDYKVHKNAVRNLLNPAYSHLRNLRFEDATQDAKIVRDIMLLCVALKNTYRETIKSVNGKARDFQATDTLITKILLGTLGCTPACDQYFIAGFRKRLSYSGFSEHFLLRVFLFYREHKAEFRRAQDSIMKQSGIRYPMMKLVDMYFWEIGSKG